MLAVTLEALLAQNEELIVVSIAAVEVFASTLAHTLDVGDATDLHLSFVDVGFVTPAAVGVLVQPRTVGIVGDVVGVALGAHTVLEVIVVAAREPSDVLRGGKFDLVEIVHVRECVAMDALAVLKLVIALGAEERLALDGALVAVEFHVVYRVVVERWSGLFALVASEIGHFRTFWGIWNEWIP